MAEPVSVPISNQSLSGDGILVQRKLFTIFGIDARERYLEEMSAKGWHLVRVSHSGMSFTFVRGNPSKVRYFYDFRCTNILELLKNSFTFNSPPRIKYLPYDDIRPENRNALISQMTCYRFFQLFYVLMIIMFGINLISPSMTIVPMLDTLHGTGFTDTWDYFALYWEFGIFMFFFLYIVFCLVCVIILQFRHRNAKRRLPAD